MWVDFWIAVAIAFVVLHFFLFCNVIRMSRPLELVWAFCFSVSCVLATMALMAWPVALGFSLVVTCMVVGVETRRPSYHGVAWQRINPRLPQWWEEQHLRSDTDSM